MVSSTGAHDVPEVDMELQTLILYTLGSSEQKFLEIFTKIYKNFD